MHYLITDETNVNEGPDTKFFIYGGLMLSDQQLTVVHEGVESIRKRYGYQPGDKFKFSTSERPKHVTREAHKDAKNEVVELCGTVGVKFVAYTILHAIIDDGNRSNYAF